LATSERDLHCLDDDPALQARLFRQVADDLRLRPVTDLVDDPWQHRGEALVELTDLPPVLLKVIVRPLDLDLRHQVELRSAGRARERRARFRQSLRTGPESIEP